MDSFMLIFVSTLRSPFFLFNFVGWIFLERSLNPNNRLYFILYKGFAIKGPLKALFHK